MIKPKLGGTVLITGGWINTGASYEKLKVSLGALGRLVQAETPGVARGPSIYQEWLDIVVLTGEAAGDVLDGSITQFKTLSPLEALAHQADDQ